MTDLEIPVRIDHEGDKDDGVVGVLIEYGEHDGVWGALIQFPDGSGGWYSHEEIEYL